MHKRKPFVLKRSCGHTLHNQDPKCSVCRVLNQNISGFIRKDPKTIKAEKDIEHLPKWALKIIFNKEDEKNERVRNYLQENR